LAAVLPRVQVFSQLSFSNCFQIDCTDFVEGAREPIQFLPMAPKSGRGKTNKAKSDKKKKEEKG
jgi:hypothetical protein